MKIRFEKNYSFIYDVCQFMLYKAIGRKDWLQKRGETEGEEEYQYAQKLTGGLEPLSRESMLFCNVGIAYGSPLTMTCRDFLLQAPETCSMQDFYEYLYRAPDIRDRIVEMYLGLKGKTDAQVLEYLAFERNLEEVYKNLLFSYLLYPKQYIEERVAQDLEKASVCVRQIYQKMHWRIDEERQKFTYEYFMKSLYGNTNLGHKTDAKTLHLMFTITNRKSIWRIEQGDALYLFLGIDWDMVAQRNRMEFPEFGNAIGDPVRWQIFYTIIETPRITVNDIMAVVGKSRNTVVHHLEVLHKAGLITMQPEGRSIVYCVDKRMFSDIVRRLEHLTDIM